MKIYKIFKSSMTIVLTFFLLISIMGLMFFNATKNILKKETIADYINNSNVLDLQVGKILKTDNTNLDDQLTIRETILIMADESGIPSVIVDDLIESQELNHFLGGFIKGIIDYAIKGTLFPTISQETINSLVSVTLTLSEKHIEIVMEEEELKVYVENYIESLQQLVPDRNYIITDSYKIDLFKQILTFNTLYIYISIAVLIILIGIFSWSYYYPIKSLGVATFISGIIFTIFGSLYWPIYNLIKNYFIKSEGILKPLINKVLTICFKEGVIATAIGLFLFILFVMINRVVLNKRKIEKNSI